MNTQIPEVCPILDIEQERKALFTELDARARQIEQAWKSTWLELADLCITMRDNELWNEGGFESYSSWLISACPTSRSMAYLAVGIREELKDISDADLKGIPLGNADILKNLNKASRTDRKLLDAAKSHPPREFISEAILSDPTAHLEKLVKKHFTATQWTTIAGALERFRVIREEPTISDADALEYMCGEWMEFCE